MGDDKASYRSRGLVIDYSMLGTINIDELAHAIVEDIKALKDDCNIHFVRAPRLRFLPTDEFGDEVVVRMPAKGPVSYLRTLHHRPACKDYEL
tara:strand:+ start:31153 stop:31431 length:279 start_codon:yes stop_codon:yes gene_type:complete